MDHELCDHLIIWLNTFDGLEAKHQTAYELSDGIAIGEALTQIAAEWFDTDWISKLKHDISPDNYRLKLSNLKKVLKGMIDYYNEVLFQDLSNFKMPDVSLIAEKSDKKELGKMLQLVLGCAINCEEKEQYIQVIMALEESVQLSVMNSIQQLLQVKEHSRIYDSTLQKEDTLDGRLKSFINDDHIAQRIHDDHAAQRIHDLEEQIRLLKEEKSSLMLENERLILSGGHGKEKYESMADKQMTQLQYTIDKLKEENFALETAKEDYKIRYEEKEKKNRELQERVEQLSILAEEARILKDEIDVMRHTQDKVTRYEATIEAYKKKLAELSDMRQQMKTLEEKNEIYMQQTMSLEEDSKRVNSLKARVETYKTQINELHSTMLTLEKRCDKAEFDAQRAKDKLQSAEAENQRLKQERDMLKETNEELSLNQNSANISFGVRSPQQHTFDDIAIQDSPFEMKEKLIRLEHQNKLLTLQMQEAENTKIQVLQANLDLSSERVNLLETENRQLSQEILELKSRLEDLELGKTNTTIDEEDQKKLQLHLDALKESNLELQRKKKHINELETQCSINSAEITELRNQLIKKEEEMGEKEEKYKKYLEKAKTVIKTLDPKVANVDSQVHDDLRNRLFEKDKIIENMERDHEKMKATKEREEKLMITAWYELSMQLHRKAADDRQAGSVGLSFLARQRQAAAVRRSSSSSSLRAKVTT
ncbi:protein Hook homolog 3 isoform X1 [Hydra vulgaris]|uniref:protein Hook homolog 3 isoform X1 n=1 Tax=Hydra vulgaris TaxID=6087 RepID=UPI0006415856|nr:protein Hook homolog 3 [Hydra vulgaris]XP_047122473.1 protein Hook homolog 3 [Hydra vulgaris]